MRVAAILAVMAGCVPPASSTPPTAHAEPEAMQRLRERIAKLELQVRASDERSAAREKKISDDVAALSDRVEALDASINASRETKASGADPERADVVYSVPDRNAPYDGPRHAPVTIVVASEFACPYCERAQATLDQLRKEYGQALRVVYQSFVVHAALATMPARALCAAGKLRRHRKMLDALWEEYRQGRAAGDLDQRFSETSLVVLAASLKLPRERFERAMKRCARDVEVELQHFRKLGVSGAPTFFINGHRMVGARPIEEFRAVIDVEKARAELAMRRGVRMRDYYKFLVATGEERAR